MECVRNTPPFEEESMVAEHSSVRNDSDSDYEDWDGMESTELDEAFSAATPLVDTLQFCDV